jgi:hypothetical protein
LLNPTFASLRACIIKAQKETDLWFSDNLVLVGLRIGQPTIEKGTIAKSYFIHPGKSELNI